MEINLNDSRPIYIQLIEYLKTTIITNTYQLGEKLPSVREFAVMLKVNPNTISRALLELEKEGLIVTKRTNGKFVTTEIKTIEKIKNTVAKEKLLLFLQDMEVLDISKEEIIKLVKGEIK